MSPLVRDVTREKEHPAPRGIARTVRPLALTQWAAWEGCSREDTVAHILGYLGDTSVMPSEIQTVSSELDMLVLGSTHAGCRNHLRGSNRTGLVVAEPVDRRCLLR